MEKPLLQGFLDRGLSLEQIGKRVGKHATTVRYWLRVHGLEPVHADDARSKGRIPRERFAALVAEGLSVREISERLGRSYSTVRYWLRRYHLRTVNTQPTGERPHAAERRCATHGVTLFVRTGTAGYYRCLRCRSEAVARRRRRVKEIVVSEAGGRCQLCGYDKYIGALEFHHVDPATKLFTVAAGGLTRSLEKIRAEARKCVLLCSNCHAEVEGGAASLP